MRCFICGDHIRGIKKTIFGHKKHNPKRHPFCSLDCLEAYQYLFPYIPIEKPNIIRLRRKHGRKTNGLPIKNCEVCNKEFKPKSKIQKCCSVECGYELIRGDKAPNWNGGTSFEPYCELFNNDLKNRVRAWYGYCCFECGTPQYLLKKKLHVHHVTYNKQTCCDGSHPLFVPLCSLCHSRTNNNRDKYMETYEFLIRQYYQGKTYFTKEEMKSYSNI